MTRATSITLAIGALGLGGALALSLAGTVAVMPSYLAAWLVLLALPVGALPVVMGLELLGFAEAPLMPGLRRLLALMPVAAILTVPVVLNAKGLYPGLGIAKSGLPGWWMTPTLLLARTAMALLAWMVLGFSFARPAPSGTARTGLAGAGLALHLVVGTLAAVDGIMAVDPAFTSAAFGLTTIVSQAGLAVSLAAVLSAPRRLTAAERRNVGVWLAVLLGAWAFLEFTQYLVVWSANLPREVVWYETRAAGIGRAAEALAVILCAVALVGLLGRGAARRPRLLGLVASALVLLHGLEMFWLVTPAFRAQFTFTLIDLLALAGAGGLGLGTALLLGDRAALRSGRLGHGAA